MPPPPGLHYATALRSDLTQLLSETCLPAYGRRKAALIQLTGQGNSLLFATPDYSGQIGFVGAWPQPVLVHLQALRAVARKLPRTEFVLMGYADGWLSIGPTRLSARVAT